jgi:RimJ/RimL family protein N-acetyltransferase
MTDLSSWTPRPTPGLVVLNGVRARVEPIDWARHGQDLFAAVGGQEREGLWRHMPVGPFAKPDALEAHFSVNAEQQGWRSMAIVDAASGRALGCAVYMRIREEHGSAEIGSVAFGAELARTALATEALWLMAAHVFDLGYRRYEWKCNAVNEASKRSAERFGYAFEGVFRNDMVMKGTSRDTAWYSIIDSEWPRLDAALRGWLAGNNFTTDGVQIRTLESFRTPA